MWLHFLKVKVNSGPGPGKIGHICISFPQDFPVYHIFRTISRTSRKTHHEEEKEHVGRTRL